MRNKIFRAVAIVTCLSVLALSTPGAIAAEKKANKFNFRFLDKPLLAISSIFPFFSPVFDTGQDITLPDSNNTVKKIKITDDKDGPKPPGGDE
jgi:hypothetical protein